MSELKKAKYLIILLLLLQASSLDARAHVIVSARVDAQKIEVGDQFHLFLEATLPQASGRLVWPSRPELTGLDRIETGRLDSFKDGKTLIYKQKITLTGFDPGRFIVPKFEFEWIDPAGNKKLLASDSFWVEVTATPVGPNSEFKPNKEFELQKQWWEYWPFILGAVLITGAVCLLVWLLRKYSRRGKRPVTIEETTEQRALRLLAELRERTIGEDEAQKQFYSELTQVVKEFIDRTYKVSSAEMTTDEVLELVRSHQDLRMMIAAFRQIFITADLAKFAKAKPGVVERTMALDAAELIVTRSQTGQKEAPIS